MINLFLYEIMLQGIYVTSVRGTYEHEVNTVLTAVLYLDSS